MLPVYLWLRGLGTSRVPYVGQAQLVVLILVHPTQLKLGRDQISRGLSSTQFVASIIQLLLYKILGQEKGTNISFMLR